MGRLRIAVDGMTCDHCNMAVGRALEGVGATRVAADFRTGLAGADFDGDPAALVEAIEEAGYTVDQVETEAGEDPPIAPRNP